MKKEEWLNKLEKSLYILEEEVQKKDIKTYLDKINELTKNGQSEEEAIKSLGSISEISEKILKSHGINPAKVKKEYIYKQFEELFKTIHNLVDEMSKNDFRSNLKIILDLLVLIVFVSILKIPFIAVRNLGDSLFTNLSITFLAGVWGVVIDLIYIIVAVVVFLNVFNRYFKRTKKKIKELESINLEQ